MITKIINKDGYLEARLNGRGMNILICQSGIRRLSWYIEREQGAFFSSHHALAVNKYIMLHNSVIAAAEAVEEILTSENP
jgi:hypothetical protein